MKATICKYFLYTILGASLSYNAYATSPQKPTPEQKGLATINQESAKAQVGFLASDELEGREAGWKSGRIAGNYIASLLQQMGMKPLFNDYFQPFDAYRVERQKKRKTAGSSGFHRTHPGRCTPEIQHAQCTGKNRRKE